MDNVQTYPGGLRLCAVMLGATVGSMSPAMAAVQHADVLDAARNWSPASHSTYWVTGLQTGSQSMQKIVPAAVNVGTDDFFLEFGKRFDAQQVGMSSTDHQLIWDNLDYLLS